MQKVERNTSELMPIADVLNTLVCEQKKEIQRISFPLAFGTSEVIFKWYERTDRFRRAYQEEVNFSLMPHNAEEYAMNGQYFAGRVFEDIGYFFVARKQAEEGRIVLSPERTLEFWKRLYPKNGEMGSPHGTGTLSGISVPDGLIIEEMGEGNRILTKCEYTLSGKQNVQGKRNGGEKDKGSYPGILSQTSLLYVAPQGVLDNETVLRLPFDTRQFKTFFNHLYSEYPGDETATLYDIQRRSMEQFSRVLEKSREQRLTREDSVYLDKVVTSPSLV